jgi:hypothetical protein
MASIIGEGRNAEVATGALAFTSRPPLSMGPSPWLVCALVAVGTCTLAAAAVAILMPGVRPLLLQEDGIIEMASVVCLAIVVLGVASASVVWGLHAPLLVAGVIGFAELMDETSFGARVFGFQPPALHGGGELDGFHDLLILAYRLLHDIGPGLAWMWVALLLVASLGIMLFALVQLRNGIGDKRSWLTDHTLIFLHVGFIGLAQAIDVAADSNALSAIEEMLEFNASLVLVFYVAQQARSLWTENTGRLAKDGGLRQNPAKRLR